MDYTVHGGLSCRSSYMYLFSVEIDTMDVYVDGEKLDTFVSVLYHRPRLRALVLLQYFLFFILFFFYSPGICNVKLNVIKFCLGIAQSYYST